MSTFSDKTHKTADFICLFKIVAVFNTSAQSSGPVTARP